MVCNTEGVKAISITFVPCRTVQNNQNSYCLRRECCSFWSELTIFLPFFTNRESVNKLVRYTCTIANFVYIWMIKESDSEASCNRWMKMFLTICLSFDLFCNTNDIMPYFYHMFIFNALSYLKLRSKSTIQIILLVHNI